MMAKNPNLKLPSKSGDPGKQLPIARGEMFIQVLDLATGRAMFLVEVIDVTFKHLKTKWDKDKLKVMPVLPQIVNRQS